MLKMSEETERVLALVVLLAAMAFTMIICGCAVPTFTKTITHFNGEKITKVEHEEKYEYSSVYSGTVCGIILGVDPNTRIPEFKAGWVRAEAGHVKEGQNLEIQREFEDISIIKGQGSGKFSIKIEDAK